MREIHYYEAEDGTIFNNRLECVKYELEQRLSKTSLRIYNNRQLMKNLLSAETYNTCTKVCVPDVEALADMSAIQEYTGFYYEIDGIGTWKYNDPSGKWFCVA